MLFIFAPHGFQFTLRLGCRAAFAYIFAVRDADIQDDPYLSDSDSLYENPSSHLDLDWESHPDLWDDEDQDVSHYSDSAGDDDYSLSQDSLLEDCLGATDLDSNETPQSDLEPSGENSLDKDGVFWVEREVKKKKVCVRVKRCEKCKEVITLGEGSSLHAFKQHQDGSRCTDTKLRKEKAAKAAHKQQRIMDMFRPRLAPLSPSNPPSQSSPNAGPSTSLNAPTRLPPPTQPHHDNTNIENSDEIPPITIDVASTVLESHSTSQVVMISALVEAGLCPGIQLDFPTPA
jgi:hypothetical protein